jgi:hydrogenase maturation protease
MSSSHGNLLVATCGNLMASDDAFGPLVARDLRQIRPPGVEVVDLDIRPAALLDHLPGRTGLILVDAVHAPGQPPGRVLDLDWFGPDRPELANDDTMSTHGLSLGMQIEMAERLGMLPPFVRLVGLTLDGTPRVGDPATPGLLRSVVSAADLIRLHAEHHHRSAMEPQYA